MQCGSTWAKLSGCKAPSENDVGFRYWRLGKRRGSCPSSDGVRGNRVSSTTLKTFVRVRVASNMQRRWASRGQQTSSTQVLLGSFVYKRCMRPALCVALLFSWEIFPSVLCVFHSVVRSSEVPRRGKLL